MSGHLLLQQVSVLGATGSIGVNTLDVLRRHKDRWQVFALSANKSVEKLLAQCIEFQPRYAVLRDVDAAQQLRVALQAQGTVTEVLSGEGGLIEIASHKDVDVVMAAIVGGAGLESSLAAAQSGKKILLANKESLVMAGHLFMDAVKTSGALLLPIDSEHNAIFQCMPDAYVTGSLPSPVSRILLTGSGGPFRTTPVEALADITVEQACAHPNWDMGAKISVDSATMMNKGLELIEACWLFDAAVSDIDIVIHPQSVIHSLVQYNDGSVLAQLGNPDMRTPIAHGLAWPERIDSGVKALDLFEVAQLQFERPDYQRFPCLALARDCAKQGGSYSCVLNAANEIAVDAFLNKKIAFTDIVNIIEKTLVLGSSIELDSIEAVKELDHKARQMALANIAETVVH